MASPSPYIPSRRSLSPQSSTSRPGPSRFGPGSGIPDHSSTGGGPASLPRRPPPPPPPIRRRSRTRSRSPPPLPLLSRAGPPGRRYDDRDRSLSPPRRRWESPRDSRWDDPRDRDPRDRDLRDRDPRDMRDSRDSRDSRDWDPRDRDRYLPPRDPRDRDWDYRDRDRYSRDPPPSYGRPPYRPPPPPRSSYQRSPPPSRRPLPPPVYAQTLPYGNGYTNVSAAGRGIGLAVAPLDAAEDLPYQRLSLSPPPVKKEETTDSIEIPTTLADEPSEPIPSNPPTVANKVSKSTKIPPHEASASSTTESKASTRSDIQSKPSSQLPAIEPVISLSTSAPAEAKTTFAAEQSATKDASKDLIPDTSTNVEVPKAATPPAATQDTSATLLATVLSTNSSDLSTTFPALEAPAVSIPSSTHLTSPKLLSTSVTFSNEVDVAPMSSPHNQPSITSEAQSAHPDDVSMEDVKPALSIETALSAPSTPPPVADGGDELDKEMEEPSFDAGSESGSVVEATPEMEVVLEATSQPVKKKELTADDLQELILSRVRAAQHTPLFGATLDPDAILKLNSTLIDSAPSRQPLQPAISNTVIDLAGLPSVQKDLALTTGQLYETFASKIQQNRAAELQKAQRLKEEYKRLNDEWLDRCDKMEKATEARKEKKLALQQAAAAAAGASSNSGSAMNGMGQSRTASMASMYGPITPGVMPHTPGTPSFMLDSSSRAARSSRRNQELGYFAQDAVRSEAEFQQILASLEDINSRDPTMRALKTTATVPDMILSLDGNGGDEFDDDNGLITDPVEFYDLIGEEESDGTWTQEEQEIFNKKFVAHPKQFGKIAEYLPNKTATQVVLHYYRSKKREDYKASTNSRGSGRKRGSGRPRGSGGKGSSLLRNLHTVDELPTIPQSSANSRVGSPLQSTSADEAMDTSASTPATPKSTTEYAPKKRSRMDNGSISSHPDPEAKRSKGFDTPGNESFASLAADMERGLTGETLPATPVTQSRKKPGPKSKKRLSATNGDESSSTSTPSAVRQKSHHKGKDSTSTTEDANGTPIVSSKKKPNFTSSYWSMTEKVAFVTAVSTYGKDWIAISKFMNSGKTPVQVRNYFQSHQDDPEVAEAVKSKAAAGSTVETKSESGSMESAQVNEETAFPSVLSQPQPTYPMPAFTPLPRSASPAARHASLEPPLRPRSGINIMSLLNNPSSTDSRSEAAKEWFDDSLASRPPVGLQTSSLRGGVPSSPPPAEPTVLESTPSNRPWSAIHPSSNLDLSGRPYGSRHSDPPVPTTPAAFTYAPATNLPSAAQHIPRTTLPSLVSRFPSAAVRSTSDSFRILPPLSSVPVSREYDAGAGHFSSSSASSIRYTDDGTSASFRTLPPPPIQVESQMGRRLSEGNEPFGMPLGRPLSAGAAVPSAGREDGVEMRGRMERRGSGDTSSLAGGQRFW